MSQSYSQRRKVGGGGPLPSTSGKTQSSTEDSPLEEATGLFKLPAELRLEIWRLALPEDTSEVCILWPINLGRRELDPDVSPPSTPFTVDTGYPIAMRVCRESRVFVLTSGLRFRYSPAAGFAVPYRLFEPALDVLYWGGENFRELPHAMMRDYMAQVQNLAIDLRWALFLSALQLRAIVHHLKGLRRLLLVLPDVDAQFSTRQYFRPPMRRCKLRRIEDDEAAAMEIDPSAGMQLCETLSLQRCVERAAQDMDANARDRGVVIGFRIELGAFVFTEYQRDGSWKEGCADRTFERWGDRSSEPNRLFPGGRFCSTDPIRSGKYIPVEERPNPGSG